MPSKIFKILIMLCVFGIICVNALAFMHAKAMTQFTESSSRTSSPEELDFVSKVGVLLRGVNIPRPSNSQTPDDYSLAFDTHNFVGSNDTSLEAWHIPVEGAEMLVLLFHGYSSSKESLLPIASQLNTMGMSTLLVDFFGSGGSGGTDTTIGYFESIDVKKSLDYAEENWSDSQIILYGQSMGAVAIMRAIAVHDADPDAVVIESIYDKMISTVKNRFSAMGVPSMPLAELLTFWGGWHSGFNAFKHNPVDYANLVVCPTLVLHGVLDPRVTIEQANAVHDQLKGWKKYSLYPSAGHVATMESDLVKWQNDIKSIVNEIDKQ